MRTPQRTDAVTRERLLISASVILALAAVGAGYYLARLTHDLHWMNRSGAAIVTLGGIVAIVDFFRRQRLQKLRHRNITIENESTRVDEFTARRILESEIRRAESHVLVVAVIMAMTGELLHGFGDLLFKKLI
jgi:hypothetical protein